LGGQNKPKHPKKETIQVAKPVVSKSPEPKKDSKKATKAPAKQEEKKAEATSPAKGKKVEPAKSQSPEKKPVQ